MLGWQEKVVAVMLAETSDLRELASLVGHDPKTFWRDANFRQADLSGQDLTGLNLSRAQMPPGVARTGRVQESLESDAPDRKVDPMAWAHAKRASGDQWLEKAMDDWSRAESHLDRAAAEMKDAIDAYVDAAAHLPMALARKRLAEVLLLLSDAAPHRAKDAIDTAEYELRIASSALESEEHKSNWESVQDARGYVLRRRARRQQGATARQTFVRAKQFHDILRESNDSAVAACGALHAATVDIQAGDPSRFKSAESVRLMSGFLSKVILENTSSANVIAAHTVCSSAFDMLRALNENRSLERDEIEKLRAALETSAQLVRSADLPLEWAEAQRYLAMLADFEAAPGQDANDALEQSPEDAAASEKTEEALAVAESVFQKAQHVLHRALMDPALAESMIEDAILDFSEAERLYKIIEDETPDLEGPLGDTSVLWRGIAHLLKAGLAPEGDAGQHLDDARFTIDLAVASLSGRKKAAHVRAAAEDAQAFALRFEASRSAEDEARFLLAEADALHRRASRAKWISRAVSYRYRVHARGAERERAVVKKQYGNLLDLRERMADTERAIKSRSADRTSPEERSVLVAVLGEIALLVRDLSKVSPEVVSAKDIDEAIGAVRAAHALAETLFLPLEWLWTKGCEQNLRALLRT